MEDKLESLEIKICYLEDYVSQMNNILTAQEKKIDQLIELNRILKEKIDILEENSKDTIENVPPPHY